MAVIRKASLDAHAAAREVGEDSPARSAARACGQAVATAHVSTHSRGAALYAQQAVWRAADPADAGAAAATERDWQYRHLLELKDSEESRKRRRLQSSTVEGFTQTLKSREYQFSKF